ncbi:MAG: EAL domain-containing protein [Alphaproteobacteria bacterium]|nr:EAL domain-containing protein [Alphaproteobacteria bacterium]
MFRTREDLAHIDGTVLAFLDGLEEPIGLWEPSVDRWAVNGRWANLFGLTDPTELRTAEDFLSLAGQTDLRWLDDWRRGNLAKPTEFDFIRMAGDARTVRLTAHACTRGQDGLPSVLMIRVEDITTATSMRLALLETERRFRDLAANIPGAIFRYVMHPDGRHEIEYMSGGCEAIWEIDAKSLQSDPAPLWDMIDPEDLPRVQEAVVRSAETLSDWSCVFRVTTTSGTRKHLHGSGKPQRLDDGGTLWNSLVLDISEQVRTERELQRLSTRDDLTDLPNRTLFKEYVDQRCKTARPGAVGVLFIDLNDFKYVNDTLGHANGDAILAEFARQLQASLPNTAILSRLGGDDFAVLVEGDQGDSAVIDAATIVEMVCARPFQTTSQPIHQPIHLKASLGAALMPFDGNEADSLLRCAEAAMYKAKREKHPGVRFFEAAIHGEFKERLDIEHSLSRALENQELTLHYQPQVCLRAGRVIGCEALVRWPESYPTRVSPSRFIPIAEETGLIRPLGRWVLDTACRQIAEWRREHDLRIPVAINFSALQFTAGDVLSDIKAALERHGLDYPDIEVEITETATMAELEAVLPILGRLRDLGCSIAIDDFGTGYSSLSYLKRIPVTHLKLDQSFVHDLHEKDAITIARTIALLGQQMGLTLIAEGVETREQEAILRDMGYDHAQGFLYSRAVNAEDFGQWALKAATTAGS